MAKWVYASFPWVEAAPDGGWGALTQRAQDDNRSTVGAIGSYYSTEDAWLTNIGFKKGIREDASQLTGDINGMIADMALTTLPGEDPNGKTYYVPALIKEAIEVSYIIRGALQVLQESNLLGPLEVVGISSINSVRKIYKEMFGSQRGIDILIEEMENMSITSGQAADGDKAADADFYGVDNRLPQGRKLGNGMLFSEAVLRLKQTYPLCVAYDPFYQYSDNPQDDLAVQPYGLNLRGNYTGYFENFLGVDSIFSRQELTRLGYGNTTAEIRQQAVMDLLDSGEAFTSDKGYRGRVDVSSVTYPLTSLIGALPAEPGQAPRDPIIGALRYPPMAPGGRAPEPSGQILGGLSATERTYQIRFKYFNTTAYNNVRKFILSEHRKFLKQQLEEAKKKKAAGDFQPEPARAASGVMSGARATAKTAPKQGDPARDAAIRILNSQLILMRNLRSLMPVATLTHYHASGRPDSPIARNLRFDHLINALCEPESVIPLLNNPMTGLDSFINAPNSALSTLVPKLTFFIGDSKGNRRKVEFPDHIHDYQIKALAKGKSSTQIKDILRNRSNHGTDAGVKSFSWDFDQIHEGDNAVKARLSLFFGSALDMMNDDYKAFLYTTGDPSSDAPRIKGRRFVKETKEKKVERLSIVLQKRQEKLTDPNQNPPVEDGKDSISRNNRASKRTAPGKPSLGLYVRVGWAVPQGKMPADAPTDFIKTIEKTQREIKLNLTGHSVSYSPNGQLTLDLEYAGSIGNALDHLSRSDVLRTRKGPTDIDFVEYSIPNIVVPVPEDSIDPEISRLDSATYANSAWPQGYIKRKAIKNYRVTEQNPNPSYRLKDVQPTVALAKAGIEYEIKTLDTLIQTMHDKTALLPKKKRAKVEKDATLAAMHDALQRHRRVAQIALDNILEKIREPKYASILERLLADKKIYYGRIIPRTDSLPVSAYGTVKSGNYTDATAGTTRHNFDVVFTKKQPKSKTETKSERLKRVKDALSDAYRTGANPALRLDPTSASTRDFDVDYGSRNLYYIRLGDLIDNILENIDNTEENNDDFYKVVLGSIRPINYGIPGFTETDVFMLADLPISIEYFGQFFIDTVVAPQRNSISLKEFLDALRLKLLSPMFREFSQTQGKKSTPIFNMTPLFSGVEAEPGAVLNQDELRQLAFNRTQANLAKNKYLVISPRTITYKKRRGIESEDIKNGIYHLKIGVDKGIVKSFSTTERNMTKFHRAMQVERSNEPDGFLVVPQNFDLTLVGNQFFPNGTTVYIDADVGFGREIAQTLGIGGYYGVVRSSHSIEGGTFETVLQCVWQSSGNKDGL